MMNLMSWKMLMKVVRALRRVAAIAIAVAPMLLVSHTLVAAGITDNVKAATLRNGLRVLVLENHKAPVATLHIFYRVGSRNETTGKTGIAHLLEHLMFRGTKTLKPEEFSNVIQENGGRDNAFTTADFTDYFEVINAANFDVPIRLEADRMANFEPKGFDSERDVVIEERRLRTDDEPQSALDEMVEAQAYLQHSYHWPVIGWMRDLEHLTLDDVLAYHSIYYSPQNAIVVAVGAFDGDKVMRQISESFGGIKNGPKPPPYHLVEPPQAGERRAELRRPAELAAFQMAYHVPSYKDADSFALELVSGVLSGGKSSRLYRRLVIEKPMVTSVDASYNMTSFDPTLFTISAQIRPGVKPDEVIAEIDKEIAAIRGQPIGADELRKIKNQEQAQFVFAQDSVFYQAMVLGVYEMIGGYKTLDQYLDRIEKVTSADIQRVARIYLVANNRTTGHLIPTGVAAKRKPGGGARGGAVHGTIR
ncbi:MAG: M16 family metallopeptidase [Candidatus Binataceae bacterium]